MKNFYYLTYIVNLIILFVIFLNLINIESFNFFKNYFDLKNKFYTIFFLSLIYILMVILNIPLTPFITTFSGAYLGVYESFFYIFLCSSFGSYLSLLLNRYINDKESIFKKKLNKYNLLFEPSFYHILILKILPIMPFSWVIIYTSNTRYSSNKFLLINMIGCTPNILLFSNLGKAILDNNLKFIILIFIIFIFLIFISYLLKDYFLKKR